MRDGEPMADASEPVVSIALSGGGHRASAWALGVLQAVVDADLGHCVTSITSVSGASITNGVVAHSVDLQTMGRREFDRSTAPLRDVIAVDGLFFPGSVPANRYVKGLLTLVCVVAGIATGALAAVVEGSRSGWMLAGVPALLLAIRFRWRGDRNRIKGIGSAPEWLLVAAMAMAIGGSAGTLSVSAASSWGRASIVTAWLATTVLLGWIAIRTLGCRGEIVKRSLDDEFFNGQALGEVDRPIDHIFATTDLETADSLYLAPRFIASYRRGVTSASGVTLAQAAQASAALPVGFPPSTIVPTEAFAGGRMPQPDEGGIPVSDGGAYDNMGDQWDIRRRARMNEWAKSKVTPTGLGPDPDLLIVANASGAWVWETWSAASVLGREITSIAKNQGIQYDQSTATRRRVLFDTFTDAVRTGTGLRGVLIQIDRPPFQVVDFLPSADDVGAVAHQKMVDRAARARRDLAELDCDDSSCAHERSSSCAARKRWRAVADFNQEVPTTLGPIGPTATNSVMTHARVSTVMYLYVLHDLASLDELEPAPELVG